MTVYRTGTSNPQTIYAQADDEPSKSDRCVGFGASDKAANELVELLNSPLLMERRRRMGVPVAKEWLESRAELEQTMALLARAAHALELALRYVDATAMPQEAQDDCHKVLDEAKGATK